MTERGGLIFKKWKFSMCDRVGRKFLTGKFLSSMEDIYIDRYVFPMGNTSRCLFHLARSNREQIRLACFFVFISNYFELKICFPDRTENHRGDKGKSWDSAESTRRH